MFTIDLGNLKLNNFAIIIFNLTFLIRNRIGPFLTGILLGYVIFKEKKNAAQNESSEPKSNWKIFYYRFKKSFDFLFLMIALATCGLILYGPHGDFAGYPLNRIANLLYQTTSRNIWSFALAYIIYACLNSQAGIIRKIFK
jgi:hypothetical protein